MLKIRLRRTGARKKPNYRIVVAESTAPRDGRFLEIIGTYNPLTDPSTVVIDGDRARHWLGVGAKPTERVVKLMAREGLIATPSFMTPSAGAEANSEAAAEDKPTAGVEPATAVEPEAE
ncbi:MAG: 30S ribosomal protein S16 [Chloroflexi bacterium]|nr:30S ribosomal protein S16 [Chloroflexota bacterium]